MDCPFCGSNKNEGNRCLACGLNRDAFNYPVEPKKPNVEPVKEVKPEVKTSRETKPVAKVDVKRSHKKK
jgi:hypothetical protein